MCWVPHAPEAGVRFSSWADTTRQLFLVFYSPRPEQLVGVTRLLEWSFGSKWCDSRAVIGLEE